MKNLIKKFLLEHHGRIEITPFGDVYLYAHRQVFIATIDQLENKLKELL